MDKTAVLEIFRSTGALLEGHFLLSSGRHSPTYFQCARVLQYPEYLHIFAREISDHYKDFNVNIVISPAIGAMVLGTLPECYFLVTAYTLLAATGIQMDVV